MKFQVINGQKMKRCSGAKRHKCNNQLTNEDGLLPISEFCKSSFTKDGYDCYCRNCNSKRTMNWFKENPEAANLIAANWRENHPIKAKRSVAEFYKRNLGVIRERIWAQYGIINLDGSPFKMVDYQIKLKKAHNQCECCGTEDKLGIDHNHQTDYARGILCYKCNLDLGKVEEVIKNNKKMPKYKHLKKLLAYLKRYPF